jgi:hypothetical protein
MREIMKPNNPFLNKKTFSSYTFHRLKMPMFENNLLTDKKSSLKNKTAGN